MKRIAASPDLTPIGAPESHRTTLSRLPQNRTEPARRLEVYSLHGLLDACNRRVDILRPLVVISLYGCYQTVACIGICQCTSFRKSPERAGPVGIAPTLTGLEPVVILLDHRPMVSQLLFYNPLYWLVKLTYLPGRPLYGVAVYSWS